MPPKAVRQANPWADPDDYAPDVVETAAQEVGITYPGSSLKAPPAVPAGATFQAVPPAPLEVPPKAVPERRTSFWSEDGSEDGRAEPDTPPFKAPPEQHLDEVAPAPFKAKVAPPPAPFKATPEPPPQVRFFPPPLTAGWNDEDPVQVPPLQVGRLPGGT